MNDLLAFPQFDVPRAGRALRVLLSNPDDLPQVFTLIESLSGFAPHRLLVGFKRRATGKRLLAERPDILPMLTDRDGLRALPTGSLGRAYLAFVESEAITPEGIRDASIAGFTEGNRPDSFVYLHQRMRDTHDIWHAATGYQGDVLGELSLLAFTLAQNWNAGVALIVAAGLLKGFGRDEMHVVVDGYRRGRAAAWLPAQEWESLLPLPLEEVRKKLKLGAPAVYSPIRTTDLRAEGIVLVRLALSPRLFDLGPGGAQGQTVQVQSRCWRSAITHFVGGPPQSCPAQEHARGDGAQGLGVHE